MVIGLLKRHSDVWVACIDTLSQYMDNTSFSSNGIGMILREGKPSGTERMLWQLIFPKVLVYPKNILIFHVVDGNEIRYQMRRTTPHQRRLALFEKNEILEAYQAGAAIEELATKYEVDAGTIRNLIKQKRI